MNHLDGRMHVAQRKRNQCRGNTAIAVSECVGIGAGYARRGEALERYFFPIGRIENQFAQVILNRRRIGNHRTFPDLNFTVARAGMTKLLPG